MTTTEAPYRIVDSNHGWYRLPEDPPNGYRGANERQREVMRLIREAPEGSTTIIFYGGAAGGAKTNLLANVGYKVAIENPGVQGLITRHAFVHLKATTLIEFDECVHPQLGYHKFDGSPAYRDVRRDSSVPWSRVWFRPMDDWLALLSTAYGFVGIEEGQETAERGFLALLSRMRHRAVKKWVIVVAFNPFQSWCVEWGMLGNLPPEIADDPQINVHFVPSYMDDNPYLRPGYKKMLEAAYSADPYMKAVLIEGKAEAVPNAIFGDLNDPENKRSFQAHELPDPAQWRRGATGWDWGTSVAHKAAGVLWGVDNHGIVWALDAWESSYGSSDELKAQAETWTNKYFHCNTARYDASQGSLHDDLARYYGDTDKGIRDVEGRIRVMRGLIAQKRIRFNWRNPAIREFYRYLTLYHRDDDSRIVEERDDMIDAGMYGLWPLEQPADTGPAPPTAHAMGYGLPAQRMPKSVGGGI